MKRNNLLTFVEIIKGSESFGNSVWISKEQILGRYFMIQCDYRNGYRVSIVHHYASESGYLGRKGVLSQAITLCNAYYRSVEKRLVSYLSKEDITILFKIKQPDCFRYKIKDSLSLKEEIGMFISFLKLKQLESNGTLLKPYFRRLAKLYTDYPWLVIESESSWWIFALLFYSKSELALEVKAAKKRLGGSVEVINENGIRYIKYNKKEVV